MFEFEIVEEIKELGKLNLPDPDLMYYYNMMNDRHIFINFDIDEDMIVNSYDIIKWNKEDKGIPIEERKPIKIFINSDGGCLNTIFHIIDIIKLSKTPVITIGMGKTYSAGGLLLMAGHKRYIFENTSFLLHDGTSGLFGNVSRLKDGFLFQQQVEERVKKFVLNSTEISEELYDENYRKDWFILDKEMVELSIADKVIDDLDEII